MEVTSKIIQINFPEGRTNRDESICVSVVEPALILLFVETRSKTFGSGCIITKVVPQTSLCLSPICINTQGGKKNGDKGSSFFDTDNTSLVKHGQRVKHCVPRVISFVNEKSSTLPQQQNLLKNTS